MRYCFFLLLIGVTTAFAAVQNTKPAVTNSASQNTNRTATNTVITNTATAKTTAADKPAVMQPVSISNNVSTSNEAVTVKSAAAPAAPVAAESKEETAYEFFTRTLTYGTPSQIKDAVERTKKSKNAREMAYIASHFAEERRKAVKLTTISFFKTIIDNNAKAVLRVAVKDEDEAVKREAFSMLAYYPDKEFEPNLIEGLKSKDVTTVDGCIKALGEIKSELAVSNLIAMYTNGVIKDSTRGEIIHSLGVLKAKEGETFIRAAASDIGEGAFLRYQAIVALGAFPSKENFTLLREILAEESPELSARVIYVLPSFAAFTDVRREIMDAAKSDAEKVRMYAVTALKNYKDDDVKKLLIYRIVSDNAPDVIYEAVESLSAFSDGPGTRASESVIETLKNVTRAGYAAKIKKRAKEILAERGVETDEKKK
ncbi:MAG: HEAT repeat domain-containing protein [Spirochaetes bacterium]|nr:HEAT repeat domain-containing protein [Spirochaetota bacterium]